MYVSFYDDGTLAYAHNAPFDGCTEVDYDVVQVNGKLYKAGSEPTDWETTLRYITLRGARDARLTATDKYTLSDYPISADNLALVKAYRAALRALPEQTGAPWDGGGKSTPWPTAPEFMTAGA